MPRYRCYACVDDKGTPGRDFEAAGPPKCPTCGCDPKANPRHARLIERVAEVHFDAPSGVPGVGVGHPACAPARSVCGGAATGEPLAVTCPKCVATPAFAAAMAGRGPDDVHPDFASLTVPDPTAQE